MTRLALLRGPLAVAIVLLFARVLMRGWAVGRGDGGAGAA